MTTTPRTSLRPPLPRTAPSSPVTSAPDRSRLLAAAAAAFAERGYRGTTLEDLEVEVGLEPGRAARLVGSKAELLWLSMGHASRMGEQTLEDVVEGLRLDTLETVDERLDAVVDLVCRMHLGIAPFVPAIAEGALVDPVALAMRQGSDLRRLGISRDLVAHLCRGPAPLPDAAETVHVLMMSETYVSFARNGWSMPRYAGWLRSTIDRHVNGDLACPGRSGRDTPGQP